MLLLSLFDYKTNTYHLLYNNGFLIYAANIVAIGISIATSAGLPLYICITTIKPYTKPTLKYRTVLFYYIKTTLLLPI